MRNGNLRAAIVGCGSIADMHVGALAHVDGVAITDVCDASAAAADRVAGETGARAWTDFDTFIAETDADVLHVCSPSGSHFDHVSAAAQRGLHVLCEKPLEVDGTLGRALVDACRAAGVSLGVVLQRRFSRDALAVQRAVSQGLLGRVISCSASIKWWRPQEYYAASPWRGTNRLDGGVLPNQAIHTLDQMVWLAGCVDAVPWARLSVETHAVEAPDYALAVLHFACGAGGTVEATTCSRPDLGCRLELVCERGAALLDDARVLRFGIDGVDHVAALPEGFSTGGAADPRDIGTAGHRAVVADFYDAVATGRAPAATGEDALGALDLIDAIRAAAARTH